MARQFFDTVGWVTWRSYSRKKILTLAILKGSLEDIWRTRRKWAN